MQPSHLTHINNSLPVLFASISPFQRCEGGVHYLSSFVNLSNIHLTCLYRQYPDTLYYNTMEHAMPTPPKGVKLVHPTPYGIKIISRSNDGIKVDTIPMKYPEEPPSPVEIDPVIAVKRYDRGTCWSCFIFKERIREYEHRGIFLQALQAGVTFNHSENMDQLRQTASQGCQLCRIFLIALESSEHGALYGQEYHLPLPEHGEVFMRQFWLESLGEPTRVNVSVAGHDFIREPSLHFVPTNGKLHKRV